MWVYCLSSGHIRRLAVLFGMVILAALLVVPRAFGRTDVVRRVSHDLRITLLPEGQRLVGIDNMIVSAPGHGTLTFFMAENAELESIEVNDVAAGYNFADGRLRIVLPPGAEKKRLHLTIGYSAVFDDPYPEVPMNTDNPGYGVTGIVSDRGTFLLAGAGWYPRIPADQTDFCIEVDAPKGVVAVTGGRSNGHNTKNGRTISEWKIEKAAEGPSLSAARYMVRERDLGGFSIATYFFEETQPLSDRYLDAVERYIRMYEDLFGPYPFEKFAVVENFFTTGYGFPSYTLIGGRVLRLPFIIDTSLGHEIAHCWWGNGVLVEYDGGNWSEGLTSYLADYLYKEQASAQKGAEHRRQWLRNYATLVDVSNDFPLLAFTSRVDNPTKVVGYDKGAMVFHMIRQLIGEDAFWSALRDVYREKLFQKVSWSNFRSAFERRGRCNGDACRLKRFFKQWVTGKGAPKLALEDVRRRRKSGGWLTTGRVVQEAPHFDLSLKLVLATDSEAVVQTVSLRGAETVFEIATDAMPVSLELDPAADVFRQLYPSEIPESINSVKGAEKVLMVLTEQAGTDAKEIAGLLVRSFGLTKAGWIHESGLNHRLMKDHDLVFIGLPENRDLVSDIPSPVAAERSLFTVDGRRYRAPADTLFAVFPHPVNQTRAAALFYSPGGRLDIRTTMKLTHYGRYSYLGFQNAINVEKGKWPVTSSPLIYSW